MKILTLSYKHLVCNTHLAFISESEVIAFDLGQANDSFARYINEHHLKVIAVFLTHGHLDHIRGLEYLDKSIPVYMFYSEVPFLEDTYLNCSKEIPPLVNIKRDVIEVIDNQIIKINDHAIKVIHTPFHTSGSCCYLLDNEYMFTGDTLFKNTVGRDDLPTGMPRKKNESLNKLKQMSLSLPNVAIYPGHGANTTLANEILHNPFLKNI